MHTDYKPIVVDWIAMLSISTRLIFPKVRERAIQELTTRMEEINAFDLIELAVKYDVQHWLKPAYRRIVTRPNLVTHVEAEKVPFPMAVMLMRSREQHWKTHNRGHSAFAASGMNTRLVQDPDHIIDSEVRVMEQISRGPASIGSSRAM